MREIQIMRQSPNAVLLQLVGWLGKVSGSGQVIGAVLWQRVLSAAVGIPLFVVAVWYGHLSLFVLTGVVMGLALWEMGRMFKAGGVKFGLPLAVAGCLVMLGDAYLFHGDNLGPAMILILFGQLIYMMVMYPAYSPTDGAVTLLGTLYIGLFVYVYLLRTLSQGWEWMTFMLATTWSSDTLAYFTGQALGHHRLSPVLSPKKTFEGATGGLVGSLLAAFIYHLIYPVTPLAKVLILGFLVGAAASLGDLVESAFKRSSGVKDASGLIPGHGGMLDRFDSMLFTAPLVYYFVCLFIIR